MANRSTDLTDGSSKKLSLPIDGGVIVDIGTGDGRYVYRSARADPGRFYIGIDPQRKPLEKVSEKIYRKPGGAGFRTPCSCKRRWMHFRKNWSTSRMRFTSISRGGAFFVPSSWGTKRCLMVCAGSLPRTRG